MPAFLFVWQCLIVIRPCSFAIITLAFGEYITYPIFNKCEQPKLVSKLIAILVVCLITYLNCQSVKLATFVQNFFTAAKLFAILIIIICGAIRLSQGHIENLANGFQGTTNSYGNIATAFYSGLWAYDGWNNLNYVTEEIKNPYVNLPRAIMLGLPLVTICYVLVNIAYLSVMSMDEILVSEAVAVTFGDRVLGVMSWCIPLFVAFSTFGAANGSCFTGGRLCYVAAREGHLVDVLSYVHVKNYTPTAALLFNAVISLIMIIPGDIASLIDFFSFTAWISYGGAMLALLYMRYTQPDLHRPYKVFIGVPILVLIASIYLVIAPIVDNPQVEYLYATLFIFAGLIFYIPFVYYKLELSIMNKVTLFFQQLLQIVPSEEEPRE
uniref:b(0,+)-type amino acid transporter 1 n=1 Tax=Strigamia maritima TaxID=126957 RepID=T1J7A2_STRMM